MQVAVDSISIPAIHYHGSRRRVLKVLLVLLDLDQNVTALVLGRAYEVAAGVRVERLLLRLQIIQVKFWVIPCCARVRYLQLQVIFVVVVVGLMGWGRTTVEHYIWILLLKWTDLTVDRCILSEPVPIIEKQTLSLLLEAWRLVLVVQRIQTLIILRSISCILCCCASTRCWIRTWSQSCWIGCCLLSFSQGVSIHFWLLSYYVQHAILQCLLIFWKEVLLPWIVTNGWI